MTRKMIARQASVLVGVTLASSACHKSYLSAGLRGDFDLSGSYVVVAHPVADECRDVSTEPAESRLDAQHRPGKLQLTIVFEGDAYPVTVRRDGRFTSSGVQRPRGGTMESCRYRVNISRTRAAEPTK